MRFKVFAILIWCSFYLGGCKHEHLPNDTHAHAHKESDLKLLTFTLYSDKTELFLEFEPLVAGEVSKLVAYITVLGERFLPLTQGQITVRLIRGGNVVKTIADESISSGVFRWTLQPEKVGKCTLVFDIKTKDYTDTITVNDFIVYPDDKAALNISVEKKGAGEITYLKEQAWKSDFASVEVKKGIFREVISASGQILSVPNNQSTVSAQISGVVTFSNSQLVQGMPVSKGASLFYIKSNESVESDLNTGIEQAQAIVVNAKKNLNRSAILVKDKIISQKEYLEAERQYEMAQSQLQNALVNKKFNQKNQRVVSPINGLVHHIYVDNGQIVAPGTPLAMLSGNKQLLLEVKVPQGEIENVQNIQSTTFSLAHSKKRYSVEELKGKVMRFGKSVKIGSPYVPLTFQINNTDGILIGSVAEVFLESNQVLDALVLPTSALIEEQGRYYVYIQRGGESFEKREVDLGGVNGENVQILKGLNQGDRVVVKGALQIKLTTASGVLPTHRH